MLPWTPRRRVPAWVPVEGLDFTDGVDSPVVALVIAGIVLLPVITLLAVFFFEWLLVLLLLPLLTFAMLRPPRRARGQRALSSGL
jgi:hypothetical protein